MPLDPPALDEGPHLSYAVQWFIFGTIALGGYPLILDKVAQGRRHGGSSLPPEPDEPDAPDRVTASEPVAG
ncbi:MAG: hypothetical protein U5R31_12355 [Acidimicrobiia bacterium]|nr:hypothetical protein [Acidimicrobiia bacterium]